MVMARSRWSLLLGLAVTNNHCQKHQQQQQQQTQFRLTIDARTLAQRPSIAEDGVTRGVTNELNRESTNTKRYVRRSVLAATCAMKSQNNVSRIRLP